jgi:hypothetical protein
VRLRDLETRFGTCLTLTLKQWAYALLLGGARQQTNLARAASADRGRRGNQEVDLHGALGELLLFGMARGLPDSADAVAYMRRQLFCTSGGRDVDGPDLLFHDSGVVIGIDVKTFDCASNKSYFAINDHKHAQLAGQCVAYMGLVCPRWARTACVMRPIPYEDVSAWKSEPLRMSGSKSRNLPIETAMRQYGLAAYSIERSRQELHSEAEIRALARKTGEGTPIAVLSRLLPEAAPYMAKAQATL